MFLSPMASEQVRSGDAGFLLGRYPEQFEWPRNDLFLAAVFLCPLPSASLSIIPPPVSLCLLKCMLVRTLASKCQKPGASWLLQKRNLWQLWLGPRTEGRVTKLEGYQDPVALFIFHLPYQPSLKDSGP